MCPHWLRCAATSISRRSRRNHRGIIGTSCPVDYRVARGKRQGILLAAKGGLQPRKSRVRRATKTRGVGLPDPDEFVELMRGCTRSGAETHAARALLECTKQGAVTHRRDPSVQG